MKSSRYTIIESDIGPLISESRATVYDVMQALDCGDGIYRIGRLYNLSPVQVETAIEYIEKHRERLEPELKEILIKKAENERYHRALIAELEKERPVQMTPKRAKLQALLDRSRRIREEMLSANYS